jgi:hypothetical protein
MNVGKLVVLFAIGGLAVSTHAHADGFGVDPEAGNNTMSAVFDAPLGERINALSNEVSCTLDWDAKSAAMSGNCEVPLKDIRVDNDDTKSEHFRQWTTNNSADPAKCSFQAKFTRVKPSKALVAEQPVAFEAEVPFTVCGRAREDGKPEHVTGTVILLPAGSYNAMKTLRVRAHVEQFNREAYHIGPKWTSGWLARVQGLAKVVAPVGTIDLNLFATSTDKATAAK